MRVSRFAIRAVLLLVIFASVSGGQGVWAFSDEKEPITVEGEVVDMFCYISRHKGSGKGPEHAACTNACIRSGGPVGFVSDDGELYLLVNKTSTPIKARVAGLAGRKVKVTGSKIERDDVGAIMVDKIERVRQTR